MYELEDVPDRVQERLLLDYVNDRILLKGQHLVSDDAATISGAKRSDLGLYWKADLTVAIQLLHMYKGVNVTPRFHEWHSKIVEHYNQLKAIKRSEGKVRLSYGGRLFPYQHAGALFLHHAKRALCADVVGSGKTIQTIAACDLAGSERILVVCPKTLLYNWAEEIVEWSEGTVGVADGPAHSRSWVIDQKTRWTVTNYEVLQNNSVPEIFSARWDMIVFDEAHRLKNRKAQQTSGANRIAGFAPRVVELSGTPIMNAAHELWSLLHLLDPKRFSSFWNFVSDFCILEQTPWGTKVVGAKNTSLLREILEPYMIRRTEQEILHDLPPMLPPKRVTVKMVERQAELYKQLEKEALLRFQSGEKMEVGNFAALVTRLRQVCLSPQILDPSEPEGEKVNAAVDLIEDWVAQGAKIVVFSWFRGFAEILKRKLDTSKIQSVIATGGQSVEQRHEAVTRFQNDDNLKVMIGTIAAMGEGITLTAANIALFAEKSWVPSHNHQAVGRLQRRTQTRPVMVVSLQCQGSVDERLEEVIFSKELLIQQIMSKNPTGEKTDEVLHAEAALNSEIMIGRAIFESMLGGGP